MHFVKDIFEEKDTEHAHNKFVRYSRGHFVGPLMKIKISKMGVKIYGSFHFVDELLMLIADFLGDKKIYVSGSLIWNRDLSGELAKHGIKYSKIKKSRGIFTYIIENEVNIKSFVDSMKGYNLLLNIKLDEISYVTKSKFPKPNKEITSDFCKAKFPASMTKKILSEFAFDVTKKNPKDIVISHEIIVEDIDLPKVENFEMARRLAKRIGVIKRKVVVDGGEPVESEHKFKV